jgi:hypothetical protein
MTLASDVKKSPAFLTVANIHTVRVGPAARGKIGS